MRPGTPHPIPGSSPKGLDETRKALVDLSSTVDLVDLDRKAGPEVNVGA